jgi:hypothetical protein
MDRKKVLRKLIRVAHANSDIRPLVISVLNRYAKEKWIPKDLEKGRCTPGSPNYDCPEGSPQYNLAQTFKKHPEWGEKGRKTQEKKKKKKGKD